MINQKNRETLIKLLNESAEKVSVEDLFLYELSPYYNEKKDNSFFSKQLEFIQMNNLLNHNGNNISFTPEQVKIYNQIIENERILISAPTSFGKTMLVKEFIFNEQPSIIVFLVPTNSLADELIEDFNSLFKPLGYTIYDTIKEDSIISDKSIFIGTQEKYYQIFQYFNLRINLFVIDEAYKLSDKINSSREVLLNRNFIDTLNVADKVVLLLPLVNEINGLDNLNFKTLSTDYAPVAKNFIPLKSFNKILIDDIKNSTESNLIYFNSPSDVESFFLDKIDFSLDENSKISKSWIERVESDFHPEWIPVKAIKNGIGIHYGPMPKFIQKKVIDLFNNSELKTLLATSSVIEGVNTPTKNIYITTATKILGDKNLIKFKNLIGRAGRLGKHKVGNVFYQELHQKHFDEANRPYENISLNFIIQNENEIIEINREEEYNSTKSSDVVDNKTGGEFKIKTQGYLEDSNYGTVPIEQISLLLNNFGFTIKQFKKLVDYCKKPEINLFGVLGTLQASDPDIFSINVVLSSGYVTINEMVENLRLQNKFKDKSLSKVVSIVIKMIYNVVPHKVIPAIEFIIELNELYRSYNSQFLLKSDIMKEANVKRILFYNKFLGQDSLKVDSSKKIMTKLFEFGIPYLRAKDHINTIAERIPTNFSIYDIRKVIFDDDAMYYLRIYFE